MSGTTTMHPPAPAARDEAWGYVCGRIAVLETQLLPRSFFESMLRAKSLSDARSGLAKTAYRAVFAADDQIRGFSDALDGWGEGAVNELLAVAPPHMIVSFFEALRRYPVFRGLFLRAAARGASPSDFEACFETLAVSPFERAILDAHIAALRTKESPQSADAVSRSLYLDSTVLALRLGIAGSATEEKIRRLLTDVAALQCWSAVLRSRWNGTSAEVIRRWVMLPEPYAEMARITAASAETNPTAGLAGFVSDGVFKTLRDAGAEEIRRNVDAAAGEAVRGQVLDLRMTVYGPERVLSYLVAFAVEQENLRLVLTSIVNGVEPRIVLERLRREYV